MNKFIFLIAASLILMSQKCDDSDHEHDGANHPFIMVKTTGCFGTCPIYTFKINKKGVANYEGQRFVKMEGEMEKKYPKKQVKGLFQAFESSDYFSYKDEYTANVTDLPSTYLTYNDGKQEKRIHLYYEVPEKLKSLSNLVKSFANSEGWIRDEENKWQ